MEEWLIRGWIPVYFVQTIIMQRWDVQRRSADLPLHCPPPFVCYERNHFCCLLQSVPNDSLRVAEGWSWMKNGPSEVHEGVKLQTPLCPQPCASKGISSFIDRVGWMSGGCRRRHRGRPATSSSSPDCFCFQVTSYLLLQLFQFLRACCMKTERFDISRSLGNVHKPQLKDNPKKKEKKKITECVFLSCLVGITDPVIAPALLHRCNFIKWIIKEMSRFINIKLS